MPADSLADELPKPAPRALVAHFRPAGPALCCVASTRACPVRRTHTFTVNIMLRETDGTWDNGYTHA
eukprot:6701152-Prymnesium_polylepis.1